MLSLEDRSALKELEGYSSTPYLDNAGYPTIGYGSRFYLDGREVTMSDPPITQSFALDLMEKIMERKWNVAKKGIKVVLNSNQIAALKLFVYNAGEYAFLDSTLLKVINSTPINEAEIKKQFRRWKYSNGKVNQGLINRREKEIVIFFKKKIQ